MKTRKATVVHTLTWPFKAEDSRKILAEISRYMNTFTLALTVDEAESILDLRTKTNAMHSTIQRVHDMQESSRKDQHKKEIIQWLSAPNVSMDQFDASQRRLDKTGTWFIEQQVYKDWKLMPGSLIWVHGIPGCGKTVLISGVIDNIREFCDQTRLSMIAYFYFKTDDTLKKTRTSMLRSLVEQLFEKSGQEERHLSRLYSSLRQQQPTAGQLLSTLKEMIAEFSNVFLVLDALDECEDKEDLLDDLEQLLKWDIPNLHILASSRNEKNIRDSLEPLCMAHGSIPVSAALVKGDIRAFVRDRLEKDKAFRRWRNQSAVKEEIENSLTEKADGMFQWVICQLKALEKCYSPSQLRKALASLPATLYDTYERILLGISKENANIAFKILQWLLFSLRPLKIEELAQLAVVEFEEEELLDKERKFWDPEDILRICPGLVTTLEDNGNGSPEERKTIVRLAHASIREYLLSQDIKKGPASKYHIEKLTAHTAISEFCLVYLRVADGSITDVVDEFPLVDYTGTHWIHHYEQVPEDAHRAHALAFDFFVRRKSTYSNWLSFYCSLPFGQYLLTPLVPRPELASTSPLNIVTAFNLTGVLKMILQSEETDTINSSAMDEAIWFASFGRFPPLEDNIQTIRFLLDSGARFTKDDRYFCTLHAASYYGFDDVVSQLLDDGANINIVGGEFGTALNAAIRGRNERLEKEAKRSHKGIKELLEKADPTTLSLLLRRGADPNASNHALKSACSHGDTPCVKLLLEYGGLPDSKALSSTLSAACDAGDIDIVRLLLDKGADINSPRALSRACFRGNLPVIRLLLELGADPRCRVDGSQDLPLNLACRRGSDEAVRLLLDKGADPNAFGDQKFTPLVDCIIYSDNLELIRILVNAGADLNLGGSSHGPPLQAASTLGNIDAAMLLINLGANINAGGGTFGSPLRGAINHPNSEVVKLLLRNGADIETPTSRYGNTLQQTLASIPGDREDISVSLGDSYDFFISIKRNGTSFLDFDRLIIEERKLNPNETIYFDCYLPSRPR
ncbi:hypothetical protein Plec18170_004624 [Paecilomyces lecythidis]